MSSESQKHPPEGNGFSQTIEGGNPPPEEASEIVRALRGGEVDAVVVEQQGQHELMALARLTDLDEINELIRALRSGEVDAFVTQENDTDKIYSVTPVHEVLAQQYNLTRAITDNATTALFIMDASQQCVFMNPAAEQLTGYSLDEVRAGGGSLHDLLHRVRPDGSPYPASECPIDQAFPSQSQMQGEETFVHKDGHFYQVGFAASPLREVSGETVGTVLEVRNITRRKAIEKELLDADRRKDEFIATLAHDLRNPLAPISNLLTLMKQFEHDPEFIHNARNTIERQLNKMVRLVDDLLDVSRITRNTIELRREPIDLATAVNDAIEMCRPMLEQFGHSLKVEMPADPVYLDADAARLCQVLGNLINNACKFTPVGGSIEVAAKVSANDVRVSVKDSGIGIPPDETKNIFEMFAQAGSRVGDRNGGLGIGLALAKRLIEMHGGSIEVASGGHMTGSEFVIRMPVIQLDAKVKPITVAPEPAAPAGRRILVVDDNFDSAESMTVLLQISGNECKMAHTGTQALKLAEEYSPDLILLDIGLPGVDGYEVCRAIRDQPWGKTISIVAMTGWGQSEDRQRSAHAGFNAHLVKPVDMIKLYEIMEAVPPRSKPTVA